MSIERIRRTRRSRRRRVLGASSANTIAARVWHGACNNAGPRSFAMLWTIAVVLLVLWALGLVSSYTLGGFIHILLVLAVIALVVQLVQGRRI
jgi:Family of unknown function (DUF5670)